MSITQAVERKLGALGRNPKEASAAELYAAVSEAAMEQIGKAWAADERDKDCARTAYYMSAEFLMGRVVTSNLLNLGLLKEVADYLSAAGADINRLEEVDDCALGNGGLGRLAACFLDSAASQGYNLNGYGIRYKYGLFRQTFEEGFQREEADDWTRFGDPWSVRRESEAVTVTFGTGRVRAVPYDMPVVGYGGKKINTLRLWQAEPAEGFDFSRFDGGDYAGAVRSRDEAERISLLLYPNDNTKKGKELRLMQEYFFSSASMQDLLRRYRRGHADLRGLADFAAVQLNDTHPVIALPELVRLLTEEGADFEGALAVAKKVFSYTNHTVMAEALEKWPATTVKKVAPAVWPVIDRIHKTLLCELKAKGVPPDGFKIVDGGAVHMARLAVYASHATNGVAKIHTEILKADTLANWYNFYPERFSNKTNGITQRRWLALCNEGLAGFITRRIGDKWILDLSELEKLVPYASDPASLDEFRAVKAENKRRLADFIAKKEGVVVDPGWMFDVQIKRLHEYKRQLLNALGLVRLWRGIKSGEIRDFTPTVFLFGAKAAPGYFRAKGIIKYLHCIADAINADPAVSRLMKVVYVTDYNVSYAEKLVAAGDVSEQISTAGTEASGTGNMKLMLNGAVTLGTYDGANIEIVEAAGEENNYIFGARVDELNALRDTYDPAALYASDPELKAVVDTLIDGTFDDGGTGMFRELYDSLIKGASWHRPDHYFVLKDFGPYVETRLRVNRDYRSPDFAKKCLLNVAAAGRFSSDRTIAEYASEIWKI